MSKVIFDIIWNNYSTHIGVKPGDPEASEYEDMMDNLGIRSYTVNAEKILDIVQNLGPAGDYGSCQWNTRTSAATATRNHRNGTAEV